MPNPLTVVAGGVGAAALVLGGLYFVFARTPRPAPPRLDADVMRGRLSIGGHERTHLTVVPRHLRPGAPLLFVLHGAMQDGQGVRAATGYAFDLLAQEHGMVVIYPDGYKGNWNDCRRAATYPARAEHIDDTGLLRALTRQAHEQHGTDPRRVFAAGYSNGGQLVFRLAAEMSGEFAGLAAVAATQPTPENFDCAGDGGPVPMLLVGGTWDRIVPYAGGVISLFGLQPRGTARSFPDTARYFAAQNGITAAPLQQPVGSSGAVMLSHAVQAGRAPVLAYTVEGGGHVVPGPRSAFPRLMGRIDRDLDAPGVIWQFFSTLPARPGDAG